MHQVLVDGQFFIQARGLKHDADAAANFLRLAPQVETENSRFAALDRQQRRQETKQRGFAAAIGAEEDEDFARLDLQRQTGQCAVLAVMMFETKDVDRG